MSAWDAYAEAVARMEAAEQAGDVLAAYEAAEAARDALARAVES